MQRISHLETTAVGVRCKFCNQGFDLHPKVLADAFRLVEAKERIAGSHFCGGSRAVRNTAKPAPVERPCRNTAGSGTTSLDEYWKRAVNGLMPTQ